MAVIDFANETASEDESSPMYEVFVAIEHGFHEFLDAGAIYVEVKTINHRGWIYKVYRDNQYRVEYKLVGYNRGDEFSFQHLKLLGFIMEQDLERVDELCREIPVMQLDNTPAGATLAIKQWVNSIKSQLAANSIIQAPN